jgi:hypothetical protein
MDEPPILLGGARVIEYAVFDQSVRPSGRTSIFVGGVPLDLNEVRGVAIAENLVEGGVFLFQCDDEWEDLAGGHYEDLSRARKSAEACYIGVAALWKTFRALTAEELAEVEAERVGLRKSAAEFPNE